jgi:putative glutamine transport system substrate-binding protein
MLKKVFLLLMLIAFATSSCEAKTNKIDLYKSIIQRDKMIVGISFDSKPFGFKDPDGQIIGMEADLAREITKRILGSKNKIVFKNVTSQDRIKTAMSDDVDMVISTMTITPQRKKIVNFSVPYFVSGQVICVKKDSKIDSLDDLMNKKIIVIFGTTGEKNIKRFAPNALIQGYVHNSDAINAFKRGSADAITTDDSLLQGFVLDNPDYTILPKRLSTEPYGIAFKKSAQTKSLKHNIDKIISEIKNDGTIETIKNKWIL